jgi:diguanylate cyclase (GGDEF)-like protein
LLTINQSSLQMPKVGIFRVILAKVAKVLKTSMRAKDIMGRWGGDEFVAIMPKTDLENAKKIVERLKSQLGKMEILAEGKRFMYKEKRKKAL